VVPASLNLIVSTYGFIFWSYHRNEKKKLSLIIVGGFGMGALFVIVEILLYYSMGFAGYVAVLLLVL
jgi:uncharacterized membrane protein YdcZ (DUF606 family)